MSIDDVNPGRSSASTENPGETQAPDEEAGPGPEMDRLPPPFFPPEEPRSEGHSGDPSREGSSGDTSPESPSPTAEAEDEGREPDAEIAVEGSEEAFISPDEPIETPEDDLPDDAFISPDDPLVPADRDEEGMVTSIGDEEPAGPPPPGPPPRSERPSIHELPYLLGTLAERIHDAGERAIQASPERGHFESALCAFLRDYLKGSED